MTDLPGRTNKTKAELQTEIYRLKRRVHTSEKAIRFFQRVGEVVSLQNLFIATIAIRKDCPTDVRERAQKLDKEMERVAWKQR